MLQRRLPQLPIRRLPPTTRNEHDMAAIGGTGDQVNGNDVPSLVCPGKRHFERKMATITGFEPDNEIS